MALALFSRACVAQYVLGMVALLGSATIVEAEVFYSKAEALQVAFPQADRVETQTFFLTPQQIKQVEDLAQAPVDSKLATFHVGHTADAVQGYAFIETHLVRTFPETFLMVVSPDGTLQKLLVLAFYEPLDYLPSDLWLEQFDQKRLTPSLRLRRDIHGIMGSTLTAQAVTQGVRKVLALFQVLIQEKTPHPGPLPQGERE